MEEVCRAIIANLACTFLKLPSTKSEWMKIAKQFYGCWNFSNALDAIDGKHITVQKPAGGGSFNIITSTHTFCCCVGSSRSQL